MAAHPGEILRTEVPGSAAALAGAAKERKNRVPLGVVRAAGDLWPPARGSEAILLLTIGTHEDVY